jgi:hypothetical protein
MPLFVHAFMPLDGPTYAWNAGLLVDLVVFGFVVWLVTIAVLRLS